MMMRRVWISCSNRSEYGLIRPILKEVAKSDQGQKELAVTLVIFSSALDSCMDDVIRDIGGCGITICQWEATQILKGESLNEHFGRLVRVFSSDSYFGCDLLLIAGDRYETFALAQAAFYQSVPIAHLFGGDISNGGHFDDHTRHAISHLASVHFPVNKTAYANLAAMHQDESRVYLIGSPVVDELADLEPNVQDRPICDVLISFNPMTLQLANRVGNEVKLTLEALKLIQVEKPLNCLATFPNHEPGSEEIVNIYRAYEKYGWFRLVESLGTPMYLIIIRDAQIVVGNSSSQVLEVPLLGQRCLLIGDRQRGRHKPDSVIHIPSVLSARSVKEAINSMLNSDAPTPCADYGVPGVSHHIIEVIKGLVLLPREYLVQKNSPLPLSIKENVRCIPL